MQKTVYQIILVTVGTTNFDMLMDACLASDFINFLNSGNFRVIYQFGHGLYTKERVEQIFKYNKDVLLNCYAFSDTLLQDMQRSDIVITHGGAGTILEALRQKKKVVAVCNEQLLHGHQEELVKFLEQQGFLSRGTVQTVQGKVCSNLVCLIKSIADRVFEEFGMPSTVSPLNSVLWEGC